MRTNTKFDVKGSNIVKFVRYKDSRLYINSNQFFEPISEKVWNFDTGGNKVLYKWLNSRKNRELRHNEIDLFIQIIEVIKKTLEYGDKLKN